MNENNYSKTPVFENGLAQPVFPFTDGKAGADYDAKTSAVVRYCVYVESDFDMDGDGKRDLIKAFVQVPRSAAEGNYKAATVLEARPYCAGVQADGYDHMKEVDSVEYPDFDMEAMKSSPEARESSGFTDAVTAAEEADPADWYYPDEGNGGSMVYENIDMYDYYLVRGFAVVVSAGIGTYGSEGFEDVGSSFERDCFKDVVEWLHGDRTAYADIDGNIEIRADWSNGNVAMTGRSYAGTMPFAVATTGVEGLKTIVPVAGIADWYSFLNQQGAQRYWPAEMLMSFLSYYCSSRYNDPSLDDATREKFLAFQHKMSMEQIKGGFDYGDFWRDGNYTLKAENIKCSALIVHGLNDENVSTKQFEMMLDSFRKSGQNVKLLLHQGPHMTPTMANKGYGINVNGTHYDEILNRWFSHYLYGVDNGAEEMSAVTVQKNTDQSQWETCDSWHTGKATVLKSGETGRTVIDTDWDKAGINADDFDEKMSTASSNMNQRYATDELKADLTIQGSVRVDFTASLTDGDSEDFFGAENVNDVDELSLDLGRNSDRMDDVKLTVLLCDVCDSTFDSIQTVDPARNTVPVSVVKKGAVVNGSSLPDFDEVKFDTVRKNYKVITRAYMDLCNPDAGYAPESSEKNISLVKGEDHQYHVYLNTTRYTAAAGHRLAVVIGTEDPVNCLLHKKYSVSIDNSSVKAVVPYSGDADEEYGLNMR